MINSTLSGTANAADITSIEAANGAGTLDGSALTDINGTAAAVLTALADLDSDPGTFGSTLTGAQALDITSIDVNGDGTLDGSALTDIDGSAAAVLTALGDLDSDPQVRFHHWHRSGNRHHFH